MGKKYQELLAKLSEDDPRQRHIKEQIQNINVNREALQKLDKLGEWYFNRQTLVASNLRSNLLAYIKSQEMVRADPLYPHQEPPQPSEYSQPVNAQF